MLLTSSVLLFRQLIFLLFSFCPPSSDFLLDPPFPSFSANCLCSLFNSLISSWLRVPCPETGALSSPCSWFHFSYCLWSVCLNVAMQVYLSHASQLLDWFCMFAFLLLSEFHFPCRGEEENALHWGEGRGRQLQAQEQGIPKKEEKQEQQTQKEREKRLCENSKPKFLLYWQQWASLHVRTNLTAFVHLWDSILSQEKMSHKYLWSWKSKSTANESMWLCQLDWMVTCRFEMIFICCRIQMSFCQEEIDSLPGKKETSKGKWVKSQ